MAVPNKPTTGPDNRSREPHRRRSATAALVACLCIGLAGCGPAAEAPVSEAQGASKAELHSADGPRGFLDPAPPPPTSDTIILSGGTLIADAVSAEHPDGLFDAIVVIQRGRLLGYGKRGSVDVPDDSVGVDTSGRFITPVDTPLSIGQPIALAVYDSRPGEDAETSAAPLFGTYRDGVWERQASAED